MAYDFDLVVLGAGPAGEKGAAQAAYFGKRVLVVESAPAPGGAAVHTGTLPSKTLRETALFLSGHRQQELYGLSVGVDRAHAAPKLLSRKNAVVESEVSRMRENFERHGIMLERGTASLEGPHNVRIAHDGQSRTVTAEYILVATGSTPFHPPGIDFSDPNIDDSDEILQLAAMPGTMTVLGGGVIGCEYATMFAALGVQVTLVEPRARLLPFLDHEMGDRLSQAMQHLGINLRLGTKAETVLCTADKQAVTCTLSDGTQLTTDKVLVASGRSGRTKGLGFETAGVTIDKRGYLLVDENYRTSAPNVYAAGDVIGFPALASTSMEQARVAMCHAFQLSYKKRVSDLLPYGVYTIPEVSCVGVSEEEARDKGLQVAVGRAFYRDNARGKIVGDKEGVVKLLFDKGSRKLVGCHCIGDRASELVHIGQAVITLGGTVETLIEMVFNYPTLSEAFKYAAYDALPHLTP